MRKQRYRIIGIIFLLLAGATHAQIDLHLSTPTPEITRYHFAYNHIPPVSVLENEDIHISVFVDDVITGDEMRIHFREGPLSGFHAMPMGYNPAEGRFEVFIESRFHGNQSLEYYIEIFPVGLSSIRIPETSGEYYTVNVIKPFSRFIKPILIALLICSPAVGAYLFSKARKAHAKRRAEYERRIRSRRRQLNREREKHYKEYLKTLSGGARPRPDSLRPESRLPAQKHGAPHSSDQKTDSPPPAEPKTRPPGNGSRSPEAGVRKPAPPKRPVSRSPLKDTTDDELRKELDNILNRTANAETVMIPQKKTASESSPKKPSSASSKKPSEHSRKTASKKDESPRKSSRDASELSRDDESKLSDLFDI
ncbi:MAG TPA: hypothetical protein PLV45_06420 [bacterium]|nr:hypothetical protein [bacterium]